MADTLNVVSIYGSLRKGSFNAALALTPGFADAHQNLALALRRVGRMQEATQHASEAARLGGGR